MTHKNREFNVGDLVRVKHPFYWFKPAAIKAGRVGIIVEFLPYAKIWKLMFGPHDLIVELSESSINIFCDKI